MRCSDTIGAIATALAKAQAELKNPEKSLTGTIQSPFPREESRTFRYASLASGLEIVRKCLSQHEIATIQTTAVDKEAGFIQLTTVLAHSSGEWMSSDWPVCPVTDTAAPHRMGAALTYARRYALFTLVGIAGEDDLDAPDLGAATSTVTGQIVEASAGRPARPNGRTANGHALAAPRITPTVGSRRRAPPRSAVLPSEESGALRTRLLAEISDLAATEEAASWAHRGLPAKNTLLPADAQAVEESFAAKVAALAAEEPGAMRPEIAQAEADTRLDDAGPNERVPSATFSAAAVGRRASLLAKTIRLRDKEHRKFVASQPCLLCGRWPSDPHHLRFAQPRAIGRKVSDEFTVPLCRIHHREVHLHGKEAGWWAKTGIEPLAHALMLWRQSHPVATTAENSVAEDRTGARAEEDEHFSSRPSGP